MKPSVLILDPTIVGRSMAQMACDQLGCESYSAMSGRTGLDSCKTLLPHVVILDCALKDMSAEHFSRNLTKLNLARFPSMLITGENLSAVLSGYHKIALAHDYLRKPFQVHVLKSVLKSLIDTSSGATSALPGLERRKKLTAMRKMECTLAAHPDVQGHLTLAQDFLLFDMNKEASRHFYAASSLESPPDRIAILAGILKPNHRLPTVLQVITSHRLTGNLVLELGNSKPSYIYFEDGRILDASGPDSVVGKKSIEASLASAVGEYKFFEMPIYHSDNINQSTEELLLEFASRWDEGQYAREGSPSTTTKSLSKLGKLISQQS